MAMALNSNAREEQILKTWEEQNTFHTIQELRKNSKPFVIYEGPPTANGKPGIHHVLTRTFKDTIARYKTMKGFYVERKAGWDEHGLPVELEVQKKLKLSTKEDIVKYGIDNFNEECKKSTQEFIKDWEKLTQRMGYWLDFEKAYRTSDPEYIKKVWLLLKKLFEDGFIYEDYKIVPWACDSQTVLSNAELEQGYKTVEHTTAFVKFHIADNTNTYFVAWTTTPWTLPGNMSLAINPNFTYYESSINDNGLKFNVISLDKQENSLPISGEKLIGVKYYHPFTGKICTVCEGDFVDKEIGTGVVHIAPAYGAYDYALWQKHKCNEIIHYINSDGSFNDKAPEFLQNENLLDQNFSVVNKKVIDYLREKNLLFKEDKINHEYPHNWRTGKPLIYTLRKSWFINVSKLSLEKINEHVNWFPKHIKDGRFGQWLKGNKDWAISRERFWGTPLPFYKSKEKVNCFYQCGSEVIDIFHKPGSDITVHYSRETWSRTPEVLDCWFDSGAMPFAAFEKYKQADVICEGIDQTRGWFYSLLVIGAAMEKSSPYKNAICLSHVLDKHGQKMSKSKKNSVDPWKIFEQEGADAVRWYMLKNPVGNPLLWDELEVKKVNQIFFNRLLNCLTFLEQQKENKNLKEEVIYDSTDSWILARMIETSEKVTNYLNDYQFYRATESIELLVDDLSNVWLRANRNRFLTGEFKVVYELLVTCLINISKLLAPFVPMLAEYLWTKLDNKGSVHASIWTDVKTYQPAKILEQMKTARKVVSEGLKIRDKNKIRLRQPLNCVMTPKEFEVSCDFIPFVKSELNVKNVKVSDCKETELDLTISDELKIEGMTRDLMRAIQAKRKDLELKRGDPIEIILDIENSLKETLKFHLDKLLPSISCVKLTYDNVEEKVTIGDAKIGLKVLTN